MSDLGDILKKNWDAAAAIVGFTSSALLTFRSLVEMPLDFRLILIGVFGSVMVALLVVTLTRPPARSGAGFTSKEAANPAGPRVVKAAKIVLILLAGALAVFLLRLTVTYHVIHLNQRADTDPAVGGIELQPSHFPTDVTINLSTPQPDVRILDWSFKNCRASDDPVDPPNIQNETEFGITIHLYKFKTSQRFCIFYRLSDRAERLTVNAATPSIEVLRDNRVSAYQKSILLYFGGGLCLFAVVFFSYRCSWFRTPRN